MLELVFPNLCVYCKKPTPSGLICPVCYSDINFIDPTRVCSICGVPISGNEKEINVYRCGACIKKEKPFFMCRSIAYFDGVLRELLHRFKYRRDLGIGKFCASLIIDNFPPNLKGFDTVMPVPVHLNKLRKREFNQSAVLAGYISKKTGAVYDPFTLVKSRETEAQIKFKNSAERRKNVYRSFSVNSLKNVEKKSILLVDDVFTSGSTVSECSAVLMDSGAFRVQVLTLLRADV